jgi:phosphoribosylglycinamide formyltransferase-1
MLAATADGTLPAEVVLVVSDRADARGLAVAAAADVPTVVLPLSPGTDRAQWDAELAAVVADAAPDLVVCAGFMRVLGPAFLERLGGRVVNTHPALLPAFPGAHGVRDALDYGVRVTGCTVHLVDEGVDTGPVLAQEAVPVHPDDTEAVLHERLKVVERRLLVDVVARMLQHGWSVHGRKVTMP